MNIISCKLSPTKISSISVIDEKYNVVSQQNVEKEEYLLLLV